MTSDFYFTATSWFPENVRVKPHSKHSATSAILTNFWPLPLLCNYSLKTRRQLNIFCARAKTWYQIVKFWSCPILIKLYRRCLWTTPNLKNQMGFYKNISGLFVSLAAMDWVFRANWVLHGLIICLIYYVHIRMLLLLQSEGQFFFWSHAGGLKKIGTRTLLPHDYLTDFFCECVSKAAVGYCNICDWLCADSVKLSA